MVAMAEGESRPFKGTISDFWRLKGSNCEGLERELTRRFSIP